jgi:hypothetical protein
MPKFHYRVALADGTIAKRSSFREYTHLIEISPQTIEGWVNDRNNAIAQEQEHWERYNKTPEEIEQEFRASIMSEISHIQSSDWTSEEAKEKRIESAVASRRYWFSAEKYAESREYSEARIKKIEEERDKGIADGHPTVGDYFASNWCGSLALAEKKLNSRDVRYWTDRGHTARIVATPLGE